MEQKMDTLLASLNEKTSLLAKLVEQEDSDVDQWMVYLDAREQIMQEIQTLVQNGATFNTQQRDLLAQMNEINLRILPQMVIRKQDLQQKIENIQQNKAVRQSYNHDGMYGYGAFFDQKK